MAGLPIHLRMPDSLGLDRSQLPFRGQMRTMNTSAISLAAAKTPRPFQTM